MPLEDELSQLIKEFSDIRHEIVEYSKEHCCKLYDDYKYVIDSIDWFAGVAFGILTSHSDQIRYMIFCLETRIKYDLTRLTEILLRIMVLRIPDDYEDSLDKLADTFEHPQLCKLSSKRCRNILI